MQKNKVIQVLNSFTPKEMREADKFVRSPIHNKHEDVIRLFQYLRKNLRGPQNKLNRGQVFHFLFPEEISFDMQKVHHVSSYLLSVLEEYLAWKEWRKDEIDYKLKLVRSLHHRRLDTHFNSIFKGTKKKHQTQPFRDSHFFHQSYLLQFEDYNNARRLGRTREFNLQQLSDAQDIAFLVDKLKNACLLQSHQAVSQTTYDTSFLEVILKFLEDHHFLETPAIAFYYHAYKALSDVNNEYSFNELKRLLEEQRDAFKFEELRDLYILAVNYCIRRLNAGNENYLREVFNMYQSGLEVDAFLDNGEFSPWTFSNIVQSGLMLGDFDTIENFILKYKDALPEKQRDAYFNYNYAWFFYQKKNYEKAMTLLAKTESSKDVLINCTAKTLLARMYFEQKEFESLNSLLQSFKVFINRKKALAYHRAPYLHFIKFLQKITQARFTHNYQKQPLAKDISETKVAAKEWLLEQLNAK